VVQRGEDLAEKMFIKALSSCKFLIDREELKFGTKTDIISRQRKSNMIFKGSWLG